MAIISDYTDATGDTVCSGLVIDDDSATGVKLKSASGDLLLTNASGALKAKFGATEQFLITEDGALAIRVTNKDGAALAKSDVVVWHSETTNRAIESTTFANNYTVAGVVYSTSIADNADGWIVILGPISTNITGTPGRGTRLGTSTTTKTAADASSTAGGTLGISISDVSVGKATVFVNVAINDTDTGGGGATVEETVTNKSGGTINAGDVVIWDTTTDSSVTTTTTANSIKWAGVVKDASIANDATGTIVTWGIINTKITGTPSRGALLGTSTTVKTAEDTSPGVGAILGVVVGVVGSGTGLVHVGHS